MMFVTRLHVQLLLALAGVLAAENFGSDHEETTTMTPVSNAPTRAFSHPDVSSKSSTESGSTETSAENPKHNTGHHFSSVSFNAGEDSYEYDASLDDWDYMEELTDSSPHLASVLLDELDRHVEEDSRASMPTSSPMTAHPDAHGHAHPHKDHAHAHAHPHGHTHPTAHPPAHPPAHSSARPPSHSSAHPLAHTTARPHIHAHPHPHPQPQPRPHPHPWLRPHMALPPPPNWADFCKEAATEDQEPFRVSDGSFHPSFEEVPGVGVYRLHARARAWEEARKVCEREGAQLAVPNSREEALALMEMHNRCPRLLPTHFNDYQYLGVHDLYSEGNWETVVGDPLNETGYMVWARNQPDNAHHHGENCLSMNRNGFFNDVPCWIELPFICEHP